MISQPWLLLIVAVGLWYMFLFRMRKVRGQTDNRLLYWTGGFMVDPKRTNFSKAILVIANIGVLYGLILAAYYLQGRL